ncbi:MAG: hypothetical protein AAGC60_24170 [Acidobacteriota bacterium]
MVPRLVDNRGLLASLVLLLGLATPALLGAIPGGIVYCYDCAFDGLGTADCVRVDFGGDRHCFVELICFLGECFQHCWTTEICFWA